MPQYEVLDEDGNLLDLVPSNEGEDRVKSILRACRSIGVVLNDYELIPVTFEDALEVLPYGYKIVFKDDSTAALLYARTK